MTPAPSTWKCTKLGGSVWVLGKADDYDVPESSLGCRYWMTLSCPSLVPPSHVHTAWLLTILKNLLQTTITTRDFQVCDWVSSVESRHNLYQFMTKPLLELITCLPLAKVRLPALPPAVHSTTVKLSSQSQAVDSDQWGSRYRYTSDFCLLDRLNLPQTPTRNRPSKKSQRLLQATMRPESTWKQTCPAVVNGVLSSFHHQLWS